MPLAVWSKALRAAERQALLAQATALRVAQQPAAARVQPELNREPEARRQDELARAQRVSEQSERPARPALQPPGQPAQQV